MKPVKIVPENKAAIEAALAAANGKARTHTFTNYSEVAEWVPDAEKRLDQLGVTKANRAGARFIVESGSTLANAYDNSAIATVITIERRSSAWYLIDATRYNLRPRHNPKRTLHVTQTQADEATRRLLATVAVMPAPQSRETAEREFDALREQRRPIPEEEGPDWARLWSDTSAELR